MPAKSNNKTGETRRWVIVGQVQGVGFRPFVYRLAQRFSVTGWVRNVLGRVEVVARGTPQTLNAFAAALIADAPLIARPRLESSERVEHANFHAFVIARSGSQDEPRIHVPPDYFLCPECLAELRDPHNRRYRYPFINCTQCGPRYTLIEALPYDRAHTSMADFTLCAACRAEYQDPANRRFHAEPIACPQCGPQLRYTAPGCGPADDTEASLQACVAALKAGRIVAVKGIGGYHLLCDARNDSAIRRLRDNKPRPDKPLAVMFPEHGARGLKAVLEEVGLDEEQILLISGSRRPIVLAPKNPRATLSKLIAPGLKEIGVILPYSPLHHLLLDDFGGPLVATSGNISGEPVMTDDHEVRGRLSRVAQAFLSHDRPILRPADDSLFRSIGHKPRPLRLGRGHAPLEFELPFVLNRPMLAVGGHIKSTLALGWKDRVVVSPHIGDLQAPKSQRVFRQVIRDLQSLYRVEAGLVVCDAHPGYASTRWAKRSGLPVAEVFHHYAHASALAAEHAFDAQWMVFTWDGTGMGPDESLWGGELLTGRPGTWRRAASFRPFHLPGGEKAGREPWRSAAALCWAADIEWRACPQGASLAYRAWQRRFNCPKSSAAGRLFDAAAALTGVLQKASYEGQGPMMLEAVAEAKALPSVRNLPLVEDETGLWVTDWQSLLPVLLDESHSVARRAAEFHAVMAGVILDQARTIRARQSIDLVGLCGGVFQNRLLTDQALRLLEEDGFDVRVCEKLPCNDGGLCYGQLIEAAARENAL